MEQLSSCYFCGAALDESVQTYRISHDGDDATAVALCQGCHRKLNTLVSSVEISTVSDSEVPEDAEDSSPNFIDSAQPGAGEPTEPTPNDSSTDSSTAEAEHVDGSTEALAQETGNESADQESLENGEEPTDIDPDVMAADEIATGEKELEDELEAEVEAELSESAESGDEADSDEQFDGTGSTESTADEPMDGEEQAADSAESSIEDEMDADVPDEFETASVDTGDEEAPEAGGAMQQTQTGASEAITDEASDEEGAPNLTAADVTSEANERYDDEPVDEEMEFGDETEEIEEEAETGEDEADDFDADADDLDDDQDDFDTNSEEFDDEDEEITHEGDNEDGATVGSSNGTTGETASDEPSSGDAVEEPAMDDDPMAQEVENDEADVGEDAVDSQTESQEAEADAADAQEDDDPLARSNVTALEYNKVMRLLQNRQFPLDRSEIEEIAVSAYDLTERQCSQVIDLAVDRGLLEEENGQLLRPE